MWILFWYISPELQFRTQKADKADWPLHAPIKIFENQSDGLRPNERNLNITRFLPRLLSGRSENGTGKMKKWTFGREMESAAVGVNSTISHKKILQRVFV